MRVLFIGNSYTFYNQMPEMLAGIARTEGQNWTVDSVTKGGWDFERFCRPGSEMYAPLAEKLREEWNVIFMQEQSYRPVSDRENFLTGAAGVRAMMGPDVPRVILYVTWGRNDPHPLLAELGMTRTEMTAALHDAYAEAARRIDAELSDVGGAFAYVKAHSPETEIYHPDNSHPSPLGSYLAALIHYATITGSLPQHSFCPAQIENPRDAETMEQLACGYLAETKKI